MRQINLIDPKLQQLPNAPAVSRTHFDKSLKPNLKAGLQELLVLNVFKEPLANVVFGQPWKMRAQR